MESYIRARVPPNPWPHLYLLICNLPHHKCRWSGTLFQAENVAIDSIIVGSFTFGKLSKKSWVNFCTLNIPVNSSKKVRKLKFDWRFLSCYQLIFLAFGIIGKPCYSSLQWCAICYDYAIWGCAAHLNMGVGVKWNVPKCIAIAMIPNARKMSR